MRKNKVFLLFKDFACDNLFLIYFVFCVFLFFNIPHFLRKSRNIFILLALSLLSSYINFILQSQASNFFTFFYFILIHLKLFSFYLKIFLDNIFSINS